MKRGGLVRTGKSGDGRATFDAQRQAHWARAEKRSLPPCRICVFSAFAALLLVSSLCVRLCSSYLLLSSASLPAGCSRTSACGRGRATGARSRPRWGSAALSPRTAVHPLHARRTDIFGTSASEGTGRPNCRRRWRRRAWRGTEVAPGARGNRRGSCERGCEHSDSGTHTAHQHHVLCPDCGRRSSPLPDVFNSLTM